MKKYFLRIVLALFLVFSFTVNANAVVAVRGATTITGGASGSLDSFDGATLNDGDICFVFYGTSFYFYKLDATSGVAESSPTTISPDTNAGNKRWILQNTAISGYTADTFSETTPAAGVTVDGLKIKDAGFALGSDADGDTYYRASGALARVPKGLADAMKGMNDAATGQAYKTLKVTDAGIMTNASQPAFLAYNSAKDSDVTGDGTQVTVDFDTEVFDIGANFTGDTFTAPVTGKYQLNACVGIEGLAAGDVIELSIITSNRVYYGNTHGFTTANASAALSVLVDMDAADTAYVRFTVTGGTKDVDITGGANGYTTFSGFLAF